MVRFAISASLLVLAACSGGGGTSSGGGGGSVVTPGPTATATPTPTPTPVSSSAFDTAEYRATTGAVSMNALAAYTRGYTGLGVKVAVIDTGLDVRGGDFTGRIDPDSENLVGGAWPGDASGHGTSVARIAAGRRDGIGTHGIAFDATLIAYGVEPPCSTSCFMSLAAVAVGIDRARLAGARVINLSMIGDNLPMAAVREAVDRATAAGIVITICAGNEGQAQPQVWGGAIAGDDSIARGLVVLVGTVDVDDHINSFSNRAGGLSDHFLTANAGSCSAATPLVSGALVLLAQANPGMSGAQLVDLLYRSARDGGAAGVDPVYGRGIVDLTRAF